MTQKNTVKRRLVSVWFPSLVTTGLWRTPDFNADGAHDADLLSAIKTTERLANWCGRYTPWTAMDDSGGLSLDISGCAHLFGGEEKLMQDLVDRLAAMGFDARAVLADTLGAAWAVARYGVPSPQGKLGAYAILEPGAQREILGSLPVASLRIGHQSAEGLRRLGLRRISDLYGIARGPLSSRFGSDVLKKLDQALGIHDEPLSPIRPVPSNRVRITFPDPVGLRDDLWAGFEKLTDALIERLEQMGVGARLLELSGFRADGTVARLVVGIGRPSRDKAHIERLVEEKFDAFDAGYGIEVMTLSAIQTDVLKAVQHDLDGQAAAEEDLAKLIDTLSNRIGADRIGHVQVTQSHVPERASVKVKDAEQTDETTAPEAPVLPRPIHLLQKPEPVEAVASVPDGPPILFKWRHNTLKIARADGPERITPEWWKEAPARLTASEQRARDYYQLEDEDGGRYWIFRSGLYGAEAQPKWYVHGLFA